MNIVDVSISEFHRSQRRGRGRSRETIQLIEAIESLKGNQAKAVVAEEGEDPRKLQAKINYAAKVANRKVRAVVEEERVVFARRRERRRG